MKIPPIGVVVLAIWLLFSFIGIGWCLKDIPIYPLPVAKEVTK